VIIAAATLRCGRSKPWQRGGAAIGGTVGQSRHRCRGMAATWSGGDIEAQRSEVWQVEVTETQQIRVMAVIRRHGGSERC
jgi:hypothetical protein